MMRKSVLDAGVESRRVLHITRITMTNTAWTTELSSETECFYLYSLDEIGIDLYATGYTRFCHDAVVRKRKMEVKISSSLTQRLKNKRANAELPPWQRRAIPM